MNTWNPGAMPSRLPPVKEPDDNPNGDRPYLPKPDDRPCPCCTGKASKRRPEHWYFERNLIGKTTIRGRTYWMCRICKNRRWTSHARAAAFVMGYL